MKTTVYMALSLDGCYAQEDGDLSWLTDIPNPTGSDFGFVDFLSTVDGIFMGRKTFDTAGAFDPWPYTQKVYVWTHRPETIPPEFAGRAQGIQGAPDQVYQTLKAQGIRHLYVDGGAAAQGFLAAGLIDRLVLTTVSLVLGQGKRLFPLPGVSQAFEVKKTEILNPWLVKTTYERLRENPAP